MFPNQAVIRALEAGVKHMGGMGSFDGNPARECGWELRVNKEVHAGCNIAWSDCLAA